MISGLFKMFPTIYSFRNHIFNIYMYKKDFALNNLQVLICHKPQPTSQSLWPGVVVHIQVPSMGQIDLFKN